MGMEGNAWVRLEPENGDDQFPDMQFLMTSLSVSVDLGLILSPSIGFSSQVRYARFLRFLCIENINLSPQFLTTCFEGILRTSFHLFHRCIENISNQSKEDKELISVRC